MVSNRRIAQAEPGDGLTGDAAPDEIVPGLLAAGGKELLAVEPGGLFAQSPQPLLLAVDGAVLPVLRNLHTGSLGQEAHGVGIVQPLDLHDEVDGAAALMAAEAVVDALVRGHGEGGRLFAVERAQAEEIAAPPGEGDVLSHHVLNGIAGGKLVQKCRRKCHGKDLLSRKTARLSRGRARPLG